ncbi:hypothetical protein [Bdellovibrio sp. BCCA]|uniref:hypothetical protein n=1 Tax=Bdellovibrio sp. BCCA TaxID=3136281 RepID=UPI0030F13E93
MKWLSIILSLLFVAGCSFKKDGSDTAKTLNSNEKEILANTLSSNFDKLALAISTNDSKLFYSVLKVSSRADLNKLSSGGRSLLEMALDGNYHDYFRDLLDAGASPFRPTYGASRLGNARIEKRELRELVVKSQRKLLAEATLVCIKNDLQILEQFLEDNYIPPTQSVCGTLNLFEYYLDKTVVDRSLKIHFVYKYVTEAQRNESYFIYVGFKNADKELLSLVGEQCSRFDRVVSINLIFSWLKNRPLDRVLSSFVALKETLSSLELRAETVGAPLPPPPPPQEQDADDDIKPVPTALFTENPEIVAYVKELVRARVAEAHDFEREVVAQQLQELGLN